MICNGKTGATRPLALGAGLLLAALALAPAGSTAKAAGDAGARRFATYANPVDLPYRYRAGAKPYREAADPTIVAFKGRWWLFASHSQGYWHSTDLLHWTFVNPTGFDVDKYAPTAVAINGRLYLTTSDGANKIWVTDDPMSGKWDVAASIPTRYWDPALFLDDDGRLYMYYGLNPVKPILVEELDPKTFQSLSPAPILVPATRETAQRGWEVVGDHNEQEGKPTFIEGSWMTKYRGRYYLEYSAPGTQFKGYANGVVTSTSPMGPFTYESYNPFAFKPTGFIAGAGHGSTFKGPDGQWWHIGTTTLSIRHPFERRLALFPSWFTPSGQLVTDTYLGDYPHYIDGDRGLTGWMLLSRKAAVSASSVLDGFPAANAVDEETRSWWAAKTGNPGEWFQIDLGAPKQIEAVQINFADQDSQGVAISSDVYRYKLDLSDDGQHWRTAIDTSTKGRDAPHDYQVLPRADQARYVRLTNIHSPDNGKFSLYDLRVFGKGTGPLPAVVGGVSAARNPADGRKATVSWQAAMGAQFYIVRLGTSPKLRTQSFQVYDRQTSVQINSLNVTGPYYVSVDAVNDVGIRRAPDTVQMK
ncbi:MAG TPA: family 43 glycosylhydrolase [Sphingobium sp.]|uniref:family 43 glycosylhydrolase n=1 Tax=Sphingobium sp. TaxID=1912891 RepID=UPI002ED1E987